MTSKRYPQFLLIGDSHIQRASRLRDGFSFGAVLAEHVERRLDVVNRGFSGYNSSHMLCILDQIIPSTSAAKVDYVLLLLGSNDSCLPSSPTNQYVPLEEYRANLKTIITHSSIKVHDPLILIVTPPPINEVHLEVQDRENGHGDLTRLQENSFRYAEAVRGLAKEFHHEKLRLVDLWGAIIKEARKVTSGDEAAMPGSKATGDNTSLRMILEDGLHLTGIGYEIFLNEVLSAMGGTWIDHDPNNHKTSWGFPRWEDAPRTSINS
ncbi:SGNH hydrolase-type esterase domain-containing protein [Amylocarpus encephaloides]|uniref:SGNH hydrolase-type esterase domain-containing protein n=1 Tax=Amylocarpus encephaloides TaxID=45428 RepID=A0A9P7YNV7_9HELO|nr:SGNH hydrolase-type esterase domain-containing protein [Amylocarpus encephaloides]